MKKKILLSISIILVMVLFVTGGIASASDISSALSEGINTITEESNGLMEAFSCFALGGIVYWIRNIV